MNHSAIFWGEFGNLVKPKLDRFAKSSHPVLILGETGAGKDVCAHYIHQRSLCAEGPFVAVNCATVPKDLAESLFFGAEVGAYTGAMRKTHGYFAQAQGGTLFLDEIGDLPLEVQTKLLRVVEDGKVPVLGAAKQLEVRVRLIVATNRDLKDMCQKGLFRIDLYYRLSILQFYLPPLRERREEIPHLTELFLRKTGKKASKELMQALTEYSWPGNIRQLKHSIDRVSVLCDKETIEICDFEFDILLNEQPQHQNLHLHQGRVSLNRVPSTLLEMEKVHILEMLQLNKWNKYKTARTLEISPSTLHYKIKNFRLNHYQPKIQ